MEMIERVAMAIWDHDADWQLLHDSEREVVRRQATRAIEAMREPTEEMLAPMQEAPAHYLGIWRAMMDAALVAEKPCFEGVNPKGASHG